MRDPLNVFLIGGGGREHALARAIARSPRLGRLYAAPGNPGIAAHATRVDVAVQDHAAVVAFCAREAIDLVVVGPEAPLVAGLVDALAAAGVAAFGPDRYGAQLEGSKGFTKDLCREHAIPTAAYARFTAAEAAKAHVRRVGAPIVVKADGLAAGKGVVVAETLEAALAAVDALGPGAIVIEEKMVGEEVSFFALCDGTTAIPFGDAQDHKRVGDGDVGPNTGGMGAYSPAPVFTPDLQARAMAEIVMPTLAAMAARGHPYRGVLYAGLMLTAEGPKLVEYNCRFGDPECQALTLRLTSDLLAHLDAAARGRLAGEDVRFADEPAVVVVLAAHGYPGAVTKGAPIPGLAALEADASVTVLHAGTAMRDGRVVADGGRVLNVAARGESVAAARAAIYGAIDRLGWAGGFCRRDIAMRAVRGADMGGGG